MYTKLQLIPIIREAIGLVNINLLLEVKGYFSARSVSVQAIAVHVIG